MIWIVRPNHIMPATQPRLWDRIPILSLSGQKVTGSESYPTKSTRDRHETLCLSPAAAARASNRARAEKGAAAAAHDVADRSSLPEATARFHRQLGRERFQARRRNLLE